jgi:hypothetical protein
MFQRFLSLGVRSLFGGSRRGQPVIAAIGAAISIWGLFRRFSRSDELVYERKLKDGETLRITQLRGAPTAVEEEA